MPSQRRMRVVGLLVVIVIMVTFYMTSAARQTRESAFYTKTEEALQAKERGGASRQQEAGTVRSRLDAAEEAAKRAADEKHKKYQNSVSGGEQDKAAARNGKYKVATKSGAKVPVQGVATVGGRPRDKLAEAERESPEDHELEIELNDILKKSPIIIFSKTFCPHSKKAKRILLEKYQIEPAPYVVELDEHELGPQLQHLLGERTKRATVPNVLVLGKSIGGGDEIEKLDHTDKLIDTVTSMAGSRIVTAERRRSKVGTKQQVLHA